MTDPAASPFSKPDALKRLKRRRASDVRFRLYGMGAIFLALGALVMLALSIGSQAISAATYHVARYDITLDPAVIAPPGENTPEEIARNVDGFWELVRDNLIATFPESDRDRATRLEVSEFITRLAVLPAARKVAARPQLIGNEIELAAPLNDDLDLYLKGQAFAERRVRVSGITSVAAQEDGSVLLTGQGAFTPIRTAMTTLESDGVNLEDGSVLLTAGAATGRLQGIEPGTARLELLTGTLDAFQGATATARIIALPEAQRVVSDQQIAWTLALQEMGRISRVPRWSLLTHSDSTYPELAGGLAALVGSLFTMLVTALVAIPIGILAAVYLEEFAPKNRLTDFIEVNINNLAAVPSIVFGLLGAAVYINFLGMPRSAPLVGGLVLALMTFPVVIIAARAALKAVPPSVRSGALAIGASQMQTVFHHVVPLAAPGILTGAILGMARALGETAPLLLIGMVAFVGDVPSSPTDESTVMPVLIFSWSNNAERAWEPMTSAMIVILLAVLLLMNGLVVFLRRKYERRW
ncbi:phosphate ABC transporter, permease protein PtsA [Hyphomonas neptunium ATCC 15444]|uniref:Phosphate transport system permease protein PstA n=2 Tax=Hyphomonas TaxID=85 RepID=Q0C0L4_HYPNA|nr:MULTISPECIES: phosphate ABC transporter permease PstA [Hyphomonas]ABI78201.1 phosphate ABC transporter, permease protein PtsA [Hyphomonas neptunium ATCC 15444]KCZ84001.1 phosphate ABC transporter permease [Hyphomonas hirschiana VP5]